MIHAVFAKRWIGSWHGPISPDSSIGGPALISIGFTDREWALAAFSLTYIDKMSAAGTRKEDFAKFATRLPEHPAGDLMRDSRSECRAGFFGDIEIDDGHGACSPASATQAVLTAPDSFKQCEHSARQGAPARQFAPYRPQGRAGNSSA